MVTHSYESVIEHAGLTPPVRLYDTAEAVTFFVAMVEIFTPAYADFVYRSLNQSAMFQELENDHLWMTDQGLSYNTKLRCVSVVTNTNDVITYYCKSKIIILNGDVIVDASNR